MKTPSENDCDNAEFLWVKLSETAASEFEAGRLSVAVEQWRKAYDASQGFDNRDPRLASSLNNLAITYRLNGNLAEAEGYYRRAIDGWDAASSWVDRMKLAPRARSSLFHLRMERRHSKEYHRIALKKYRQLLPGAHAGTLNNLAELFHITHRLQDAEQLYKQALQQRVSSMGGHESGVVIIRNNVASLSNTNRQPADPVTRPSHAPSNGCVFSAQATRNRWIVDQPPEFTDEGRLMAAILLTRVLDHARLSGVP